MISPAYRAQVDLLLHILPYVAQEESLALKGGTAINLFVHDMPRFSIDIDLTYLPFADRGEALQNIADALRRIKDRLEKAIPGITANILSQSGGQDAKLVCRLQQATIKVEVNTVTRGHLWPTRKMQVTTATQDEFAKSAVINVVSHGELFGGKICAALDRQHPRDVFDIAQLFAHEGITDDVRLGFIGSLLSHPRPIHEVIRPNFQDRRTEFDTQFAGMTIAPFNYDDFEVARERLVQEIHARLTADERAFLLSFKSGEPDWDLVPIKVLQTMPAVQWKLSHIRQLKQNAPKHMEHLDALRKALSA